MTVSPEARAAIDAMNKRQKALTEVARLAAAGRTATITPDWEVLEVTGTNRQVSQKETKTKSGTIKEVRVDTAPRTKVIVGAGVENVDDTLPLYSGDWTEFLPGSTAKTAEQKWAKQEWKRRLPMFEMALGFDALPEPVQSRKFKYGWLHLYNLYGVYYIANDKNQVVDIIVKGCSLSSAPETEVFDKSTSKVVVTERVPEFVPKPVPEVTKPLVIETAENRLCREIRQTNPAALFRAKKELDDLKGFTSIIFGHKTLDLLVGYKYPQDCKLGAEQMKDLDVVWTRPSESNGQSLKIQGPSGIESHLQHMRRMPKLIAWGRHSCNLRKGIK